MASYTQNVHKSDQKFPAKSVKSLGLLYTILHGINIYHSNCFHKISWSDH